MATATTDRPRKRGGRPAGAKRTVGLKIQLTPEESEILRRASEIEGLGPSLLARAAVVARARRVLAGAENA